MLEVNTGNLFFVGLMGAGKTTVGKAIAQRYGKDFFDSDQEIEARTGANIPLIFELEGEAGFRARESAVIADLAARRNIVLATGGGAVISPDNRRCLKENGIVVYLRAHVSDLLRRTRHDRSRPLLQTDDRRGRLEELLAQREGFYMDVADLVVDTGNQSVAALIRRLERELKGRPDFRQAVAV